MRVAALEAVGFFGGPDIRDTLTMALTEEDNRFRLAAARGLANLQDPETSALLVSLLRSRSVPGMAPIVREALFDLGEGAHDELYLAMRSPADGRPVRGRMMGRYLESQRDFWEPVEARLAADPELDAAIERTGFVDDPAAALSDLDILILTSHSEASPICVHEAMSIGIPQVVFDVGGVREMLGEKGEAGLIVPAGDIDALVDGIARLLDDPALYARMAAAGPERARAHFSLEACVERHIAAYRAAIRGAKN